MHPSNASTAIDIAALVGAAQDLCIELNRLRFGPPVTHVYNPLDYAWPAHETYLRSFGGSSKRVVFLGMNPGPFGMAQTGVPFGEVKAVRDWLQITGEIGRPPREHVKRPILGWSCSRSEISGQRLWGLFAERFGTPKSFFRDHFVLNYCPLAFMEETGRNRTPDKLPAAEQTKLFAACDRHLALALEILSPEWVIGIGDFAKRRAEQVCSGSGSIRIGQILHPSPANPAANRAWARLASAQLEQLGIWKSR